MGLAHPLRAGRGARHRRLLHPAWLAETQSFENTKKDGAPQSGLVQLFTKHPRETLTVMLLTAGGTLAFYAYSIYMQKFW